MSLMIVVPPKPGTVACHVADLRRTPEGRVAHIVPLSVLGRSANVSTLPRRSSCIASARRANIASIVGSEDACEGLAAALAGVEGVAVAEELLPYVVRAVVLQPYASAKLVSMRTLLLRMCI